MRRNKKLYDERYSCQLVLHPPNIDLLLISVFEKAYQILEVLIELFMKNSNKEPPCKGSKKRLRKDKRNRNR